MNANCAAPRGNVLPRRWTVLAVLALLACGGHVWGQNLAPEGAAAADPVRQGFRPVWRPVRPAVDRPQPRRSERQAQLVDLGDPQTQDQSDATADSPPDTASDTQAEPTPESTSTLPLNIVMPGEPGALAMPYEGIPGDPNCADPYGWMAPGTHWWGGGGEGAMFSVPCWRPLGGRLWVEGDYLLWWTRGSEVPPAVTVATPGTAIGTAGVLGQPPTSVVFGGGGLNDQVHPGGRLAMGYWFANRENLGVEVDTWWLGRLLTRWESNQDISPIIARPFHDSDANAEDAVLVAYPGVLDGSLRADLTTEMQGAGIMGRFVGLDTEVLRVEGMAGYRYARLSEDLLINSTTTWIVDQGNIPSGTVRGIHDRFSTTNDFHGAVIGTAVTGQLSKVSLELAAKLAIGGSLAKVRIDGATTTDVPGIGVTTTAGGVLAQQTNIGNYSRREFAVMPELGIKLGYQVTRCVEMSVGYTFLYWSTVVRPGEQIDRDVDPDLFLAPPGPGIGPHPEFVMRTSGFWAHGLNLAVIAEF